MTTDTPDPLAPFFAGEPKVETEPTLDSLIPPTYDAESALPPDTLVTCKTCGGSFPLHGFHECPGLSPPPPRPPDPLECPHVCTGRELVLMAMKGSSSQNPTARLETAISHASDWVARNAPHLYTVAQAASILMGIFRKGPKIG